MSENLHWLQTKRHIKRTKENPGGIINVESPLHYSNVSLVDPVNNSPVRVCWRFLEDGTKVGTGRAWRLHHCNVTSGTAPCILRRGRTDTKSKNRGMLKQAQSSVNCRCASRAAG